MNETIPDYRDVLLRHFELKRAKRPSYSLRAYAKDLQLTPSNLSDVLKGRCGISSAVASRIAEALKLGSEESAFFADLVESKHARSRADREAALKRVQQFKADP
ncbi:MAG: TIGR02147 family protein, partial [Proteobacteria bacterium]